MMTHHTLTQLKTMKLDGMARALEEQLALPAAGQLSFEERFAMLVDREAAWRDSRRLDRLLKLAKLKHPGACLEDVDYRPGRGIDKRLVATLGACEWVRGAQNVLLTGPTGVSEWISSL